METYIHGVVCSLRPALLGGPKGILPCQRQLMQFRSTSISYVISGVQGTLNEGSKTFIDLHVVFKAFSMHAATLAWYKLRGSIYPHRACYDINVHLGAVQVLFKVPCC